MKPIFFPRRRIRDGFTLVEMLTVMAILVILMGLLVLLMPGWQQHSRATTGASQLQQWLLVAKQRAVLDQAPRGVRLLPHEAYSDATDPDYLIKKNWFVKAQYIMQPEDFSGSLLFTLASNGATKASPPFNVVYNDPADSSGRTLVLDGLNIEIDGGDSSDQSVWQIQPGDYIQIGNSGLVRRIDSITGAGTGPYRITIAEKFPQNVKKFISGNILYPGTPYRVIRGPRVMGDEILELPLDVAIDLNTNIKYGNSVTRNPDGSIDIMFGPNGAVLDNVASDRLVFWVRDIVEMADEFQGSPSLVVVFTRTGAVNSYTLDPELHSSNPYGIIQ